MKIPYKIQSIYINILKHKTQLYSIKDLDTHKFNGIILFDRKTGNLFTTLYKSHRGVVGTRLIVDQ